MGAWTGATDAVSFPCRSSRFEELCVPREKVRCDSSSSVNSDDLPRIPYVRARFFPREAERWEEKAKTSELGTGNTKEESEEGFFTLSRASYPGD